MPKKHFNKKFQSSRKQAIAGMTGDAGDFAHIGPVKEIIESFGH